MCALAIELRGARKNAMRRRHKPGEMAADGLELSAFEVSLAGYMLAKGSSSIEGMHGKISIDLVQQKKY